MQSDVVNKHTKLNDKIHTAQRFCNPCWLRQETKNRKILKNDTQHKIRFLTQYVFVNYCVIFNDCYIFEYMKQI